jgi:hypothetical protein
MCKSAAVRDELPISINIKSCSAMVFHPGFIPKNSKLVPMIGYFIQAELVPLALRDQRGNI